jgi:sugar lactone lactonase YvrE
MIRHQATPATDEIYVLAEGPVWDEVRQRVLWVDINGRHVLTGELRSGRVIETSRLTFDGTVGAVVCSREGQLLVAGAQGVFTVPADPAGTIPVDAVDPVDPVVDPVDTDSGIRLIPAEQRSRLNDGKCDPAGRFVVGSLALDDRQDQERLLRIDSSRQVAVIDEHLGLSNGLGWSPDGTWFYSIDTLARLIWVRRYDVDSGQCGERRVFLKISDGNPDGMCVDAEGNLWVAIWGAGEVRCFSATGEHLATVTVAAPNTSSVAFAGPDLDTLLITTASEQLSPAQLTQFPDSGRLFTASVGKTGLPARYWTGF